MPITTTTLITHLKEKIASHAGAISFSDFMEEALYHPIFGYYNQSPFQIGKFGDFTTAPEISSLFGYCLANQCQQILGSLPQGCILEIGAGSGKLAVDILTHLKEADALPRKYYILEISPSLRARQQKLLKECLPDGDERVEWLTDWPRDFVGVVIANEVLDALPFDCFEIKNGEVYERVIQCANDSLLMKAVAPITPHLKDAVLALGDLPDNYASEINLKLSLFLDGLISSVRQGVILFLDYGYGRQEYYHPERNRGTLTCFYQHQKNANPLLNIGSQDITAHVDFTRVIEIACELGCSLAGFTTQASFLLANGLLAFAEASALTQVETVNQNQAIKTLTLPSEMGEVVKVMALGKGCSHPLSGFRLSDRSREL